MKPRELLTNQDLQKVYDRAKSIYLSGQNTDYEPHLWTILSFVMAYCDLAGLDRPTQYDRNFYASNPDTE